MALTFALAGTSILHRYDPRAKLIFLAVLAVCFFVPGPAWVHASWVICLVVVIAACLGLRELGRALAPIAPVLAVICLLTPVFRRGGEALWQPFGVRVLTVDGLAEVLRLVTRFTGLTLAFFAAFRTLDMDEMVEALRWFGLPFRAALVLIIALRFIPTLFGVYQSVQDAHLLRMSRGKRRGFLARTLPLLTSVVIHSVRGIPSLAMALELRGFGRSEKRTSFRVLPAGMSLAVSLAATAAMSAFLIVPLAIPLRLFEAPFFR
jgi:energy-coupling factor transport system permease protein